MANLNKAQVIGNVTTDVELKQTTTGKSYLNFSLATNRRWTDSSGAKQEKADFHNIVFWGKPAEILAQYLKKGNSLYVEGRMETRSWEKEDGSKAYKMEII